MKTGVERVLARGVLSEKRIIALYLVASTLLYTSSISLLAVSIVLISRSSYRPQILTLGVFIAATQYFAIGRSAARYLERVSSHRLVLSSTRPLRLAIFSAARGLFPTSVSNVNRQMIVGGATRGVDSATSLFLRLYLPMIQMGIVALFVFTLGVFFDPITSILVCVLLGAMTAYSYFSSRGTMSKAANRHSESLVSFEASISELARDSEALYISGVVDDASHRIYRKIDEHSRVEATFERRSFVASLAVTTATQLSFVVATWSSSLRVQAHSLAATSFGVSAMIASGSFEVAASLMVFGATASRPRREVVEVDELMRRGLAHQSAETPIDKDHSDGANGAKRLEVVEVNGATYCYEQGKEVGPFDITFERGKSYLVLGESGTGKSTLAYLVCGFVRPTSGSVRLFASEGTELYDFDRMVGFQGEEVDVFNTSIRSNLAIANSKANDNEMIEILGHVGLSYLLDGEGLSSMIGQFGRRLSGGESRRLAIARSILSGLEMIIFDEPTAGVDEDMAVQVIAEITSLQERLAIVVVISHDVGLAPYFDEVLTIQ